MKKSTHTNNFARKLLMLLTAMLFLLQATQVSAQCTNTSSWGSGSAPAIGATVTFSTCVFGGEYSPISSVVSGAAYTSTSSVAR